MLGGKAKIEPPKLAAVGKREGWIAFALSLCSFGVASIAAFELEQFSVLVSFLALNTASAVVIFSLYQQRSTAERRYAELQDAASQLHITALTDPLTNLPNRLAFRSKIDELLEQNDGTELAFLFADLDRFKEVNDTLGHDVGDMLLSQVAERLNGKLQDGDHLARMGGDEFAAILIGNRSHMRIEDSAAAMVNAISEPFLINDNLVSVGISIGIALAEKGISNAEEVMRRSDIAMYRAKSNRLGFCIFDDMMDALATSRATLRADLDHALEHNELRLALQPIVFAETGEIKSVEALLRWSHPVHGEVMPSDLIEIAEESGQIVALGDWVIDEALRAAQVLGDVPVAINVSPMQFAHHGFATKLSNKLVATRVAPELIEIEITEGVLISHHVIAKNAIRQLRQIGVKVVLDDFGTGYSSLSYLQNFDFDKLKIDRSFLRDIGSQQRATQVLRNVVELGHSLGMTVVAEGVENEWQCRLLQLLRCDYLQGYYFSPPVPIAQIEGLRQSMLQKSADAHASNATPPLRKISQNAA
jgi:diguanylate cyclase (GGDEF)-like protein